MRVQMRVRDFFGLAVGLPAILLAGSCEGNSASRGPNEGSGSGRAGASGVSGESGRAGASGSAGVGGTSGGTSGASGDAGAGAGGESVGGYSGGGSAGEAGIGNGGSSGEAGVGGAGGDSCMPHTITTTLRPSAIVVMLDRSGSMFQDQMPPTRWERVSAGLRQFLTDPSSVGYGVGLRMFPHDVPAVGCASPACNAASCAELLYPVTGLTVSEGTALAGLVDSYAPTLMTPSGGTPTSVAVEGSLVAAEAYAAAHPLEKTSVVFITDGEPNGCNEDIVEIAATVSAALSTAWIRTYVIGVGDFGPADLILAFLDQLASAGGTGESLVVLDGPFQTSEFFAALHSIRTSPAGCDLPLPLSTPEGPVDPDLIQVEHIATGGLRTTLVRVPSAAGCGMVPGFHYDEPTNPRRIVLCPSGCDLAENDPGTTFDLVVRCAN
jgi:hypothetical protein